MAVQQEIKSQLAKLLATEDLIVEHKNCETASFNVHTRLLTLPMWDKASNTVYDLLVGHEVGHALFTPDEDPPAHVPFQFVNVVEDARIEKMMKRKYPGLAKTFFKGYQELNEEDFFSISDGDVADFNLADRANLYFKVGNFVDISFTEEEVSIIRMIEDCETFEDVVRVAEILHNYCKKKKEDKPEVPTPSQSDEGQVSPDSESEQQIEDTDEQGTETPEQQPISDDSSSDIDDIAIDDIEVRTADALSDNIKDLIRDALYENNYVEIPNLDFKSVVVNNTDIHEYCNKHYDRYHEFPETFDEPDKMFVEFKRSAQKEVNYLVKEFECRKSAAAYSRSSVARTGVLDCSRLHTYKYNEDLFKKVTVLPEGKNHGLIFVLDWSGSMSSVMTDTCKQLFNLIWFCKKVSIPFEVYAFSNEWNHNHYDENGNSIVPPITPHYVKKENLLSVDDRFSMLNILSSKISGKELEKQMKNIWRLAYAFGRSYQVRYSWPERLSLSGTPLNESLVALHTILPKFQKENKLQKVQCIVLTDGEANQLSYHAEIKIGRSEPYIGNRRCDCECTLLRDRKLGTTYKFGWGYHEFTKTMLRNLKDKFPQVNFIGIRVIEGRNINGFIKLFYSSYNEVNKLQQEWRKTRSICIKDSGYDAYFALSSSSLSQDSSFDVDDGATKAKIKSAFVKSLKVKKLNKKVLGEFISLVV
tara:strand:+ start:432 stop:2531 length:2100 start_codon:yes stop_codon:yes gene_type:complete